MLTSRIVEACTPWQVTETTHLYELTIREGAQVLAPEGKLITLTVDGCGRPIAPGYYKGDVVVTVSEPYQMAPHGLKLNFGEMMHGSPLGPEFNTPIKAAAAVTDNQVSESVSIPAILQDGTVSGTGADGIYMASTEEDICGIVVAGSSDYAIRNSRFDLEANGHDDWLGLGTAVTAIDDANVLIDNCQFNYSAVTRCTVQAGGNSKLTVRNSKLINIAPDGEDWVGAFSWQVGFRGHNRLAQLCDNADVRYENCVMHGNGWGLLSIDGSGDGKVRPDDPAEWPADCQTPGYAVTMYVKDCDMTLTGPRQHGYGAFCIGDNHITFDHSRVDVFGYPILLMGMAGKGRFDVINGSVITGRRFGALIIDDDNSTLKIEDSAFKTGKSSICIKGSSTRIDVKNTAMTAGNGTILQLMDNDEAGMNQADYRIPVYEKDVRDPDRDLTAVNPTEDVVLNLTDCTLTGNLYNSTTNIRAGKRVTRGGMGKLHDRVLGLVPMPPADAPSPASMRHNGNDLCGAFNLGVNLANTTLTGVISAASQAYREGLAVITCDNSDELSNVTQSAAPAVNNGVIVTLDAASKWIVTGTSYLTALTLAEGAVLAAADGKTLKLTVDGAEADVKPGSYAGEIVLTAE